MEEFIAREELENQFPTLRGCQYANHASLSPWPRVTTEAVQEFARRNLEEGPLAYGDWMANDRRLRQRIATMMNAGSADDVSLLHNTTEGINIIANGLPWRRGDNLVTARQEFISNRLAWQRLENLGVTLRVVDLRAEDEPEQALINALDERTRLLALSSVQWADGFRLHLAPLGAACRSAGVIFFVDAIQHFGALRIDVRSDRIDLLCAGAHKWQLGPEGIAVFYCHEDLRPQLRLHQWGWHMLEDRFQFETPGRRPAADGRRFEAGTPNRLGEIALNASLELLEGVGMDIVERAVLDNTARLVDGLEGIDGTRVFSATDPARHSGIVNFGHSSVDPDDLQLRLRQAGVVAIRREKGVRLSPHFYQRGRPIERLLETVEQTIHSPGGG